MSEDAEAIAAVFGRAATTYDTVTPFFARLGARLVEIADLRRGERVLDLGCGRGATLLPAAERVGPAGSVVGVDLAEEMVALTAADVERLGVANASVLRMDAEALELPDGCVDVVVSSFVLHVLPHPDRAAAACLRVLRPGGRCVAATPIWVSPFDFFGRLIRSFAPRGTRPMAVAVHPHFDLVALLTTAGFHVGDVADEDVAFVLADEEAWWWWAWSQGMRALLEILPPEALAELREQAFDELRRWETSEGLALRQRARFVVAEKPPYAGCPT